LAITKVYFILITSKLSDNRKEVSTLQIALFITKSCKIAQHQSDPPQASSVTAVG